MSGKETTIEDFEEFGWRRTAPFARRAVMTLFSWQQPGWTFLWAVAAGLVFCAFAFMAPALLSVSPTVDLIAPIATARAITGGEAMLVDQQSPFYLFLIMGADYFADSPGRIHLVAKAFSALIVAYSLSHIASSRLPIIQTVLISAAFAAYVAAPFAGPAEFGLALLLVCSLCFVSASADNSAKRARGEGLLAGALLYSLWILSPVFSLAGFLVLSACPFLSGRSGLTRYATTLIAFAVLAGVCEYFAPGINLARASAASGVLTMDATFSNRETAIGLSGIAMSTIVIIAATVVFGGREHARGWIAAFALGAVAFVAARLAGANVLPVFIIVAAITCFSVSSPFYDGLFSNHDRASVATALTASSLTCFWTVAIIINAFGQFSLQRQVAEDTPENIKSELALVQPGGPTIARWVEEGRFTTPEAREYFALAPIDQSVMLLEAASRAKTISEQGLEVAILTGADTACILTNARSCRASGAQAAAGAKVVFVPRLDLDPATAETKDKAEALLYTEFELIERSALWEIWVRRGVTIPANFWSGAQG
ncbi:MAG: hypothetical protein HKP25_09130 [Marinicaulis sp.]|nr:hypothetical protein [Marinicaulis sp.]